MEACVLLMHGLHHLLSNTLPLMSGVYQHVGKVDDKIAVRDGIPNANKLAIETCSYKTMRIAECR